MVLVCHRWGLDFYMVIFQNSVPFELREVCLYRAELSSLARYNPNLRKLQYRLEIWVKDRNELSVGHEIVNDVLECCDYGDWFILLQLANHFDPQV